MFREEKALSTRVHLNLLLNECNPVRGFLQRFCIREKIFSQPYRRSSLEWPQIIPRVLTECLRSLLRVPDLINEVVSETRFNMGVVDASDLVSLSAALMVMATLDDSAQIHAFSVLKLLVERAAGQHVFISLKMTTFTCHHHPHGDVTRWLWAPLISRLMICQNRSALNLLKDSPVIRSSPAFTSPPLIMSWEEATGYSPVTLGFIAVHFQSKELLNDVLSRKQQKGVLSALLDHLHISDDESRHWRFKQANLDISETTRTWLSVRKEMLTKFLNAAQLYRRVCRAAIRNHVNVVRLLVGLWCVSPDPDGHSLPLKLAIKNKSHDVIEFLTGTVRSDFSTEPVTYRGSLIISAR